jgi:hypothetical protein
MTYTTAEIAYSHYGNVSYRIELDLSNPHRHMQRHIWTRETGEVEAQDWIDAGRISERDLERGKYRPVA